MEGAINSSKSMQYSEVLINEINSFDNQNDNEGKEPSLGTNA